MVTLGPSLLRGSLPVVTLGPRVWSQSGPVKSLGVDPEKRIHVNPSTAGMGVSVHRPSSFWPFSKSQPYTTLSAHQSTEHLVCAESATHLSAHERTTHPVCARTYYTPCLCTNVLHTLSMHHRPMASAGAAGTPAPAPEVAAPAPNLSPSTI